MHICIWVPSPQSTRNNLSRKLMICALGKCLVEGFALPQPSMVTSNFSILQKYKKPNVAGSSGLYIFNTFQRFLSRKILRSESPVNTRFLTPKKRSDIFRNTSDIFQNTRHIFFIFCGRRFSVPENKRAKTEVNVK